MEKPWPAQGSQPPHASAAWEAAAGRGPPTGQRSRNQTVTLPRRRDESRRGRQECRRRGAWRFSGL